MMRLELIEGTSSKFWEIVLAGKSFTVRYGRLGTAGREQKKTFASPAAALAAHDALVVEKIKKGYQEARRASASPPKKKKKSTPVKKPDARKPPVAGGSPESPCTAIEAYFDTLRDEGFDVSDVTVRPQSAAALEGLEKKLGAPLPEQVRAFLSRGLKAGQCDVKDGDRHGAIGFDFMDAKQVVKSTLLLRQLATGDDEHARIARTGIALTWSEPQVVVADAVYHFSFRNPISRIAGSLDELLIAWLGAGCFASHDFELVWRRVKHLVPAPVPPARNSWVKAYRKQFPS